MVEYEKPLKERANALEDMYKQRDKDAFNNMIKAKREKYIQGKLKEEARRRLVAENRRQFALKKKRNVMAKKLKKLAIDEERAVVEMLKRQELEAQQEDEKSGKSYQQEDHDVEMMLKIIYSDQHLCNFEDRLIRKVSGLIYIESKDLAEIKLKVKNDLHSK